MFSRTVKGNQEISCVPSMAFPDKTSIPPTIAAALSATLPGGLATSAKTTIAILIPHFGEAELLYRCLDSIEFQTRRPDEVLIYNNTGCRLTLPGKDWSFSISITESSHNQGFARAVNALANLAQSDLLLLLNNDAALDPNCLAAIENGASTFPDYCSFALVVFTSSRQRRIQSIGLMYTAFGFGNRSNSISADVLDLPGDVFCPCGAAAVYRRTEFLHMGGMNPRFFFGYEDLELGLRFRLAGLCCRLLPEATVTHLLSANIHQYPSLKVREAVKNSLWTLLARHPFKLFGRNCVTTCRFYLTWWFRLARCGYVTPVAIAILTVVVQLPSICVSRGLFWLRFSRRAQAVLGPLYDGRVEVYTPHGHTLIEVNQPKALS